MTNPTPDPAIVVTASPAATGPTPYEQCMGCVRLVCCACPYAVGWIITATARVFWNGLRHGWCDVAGIGEAAEVLTAPTPVDETIK